MKLKILSKSTKITIACIAGIIFFSGILVFFSKYEKNRDLNIENFQTQIEKFYSVNGTQVSKEVSQLRPLAVMVENHPDSWPQSGLSQADIVYEVLAEGGITRFLALFQTQEVSSIGPVRSAREYFAQIADEWHALYAHVGGSNEVIAQLKNGEYKHLDDANEYFNFDYFPRKQGKVQPHHIFTSTQKLRDLISFYKYETKATFSPWQFQEVGELPTTTVKSIFIDFSRPGYEVTWQYNKETNEYARLQYFKSHIDENTGKQITAKNIVLQIVEVTPVPKDPLLSVDIDLNSGGNAIVFLNGVSVEGTWKKEKGKLRFYDEFENEIKFTPGLIWVELVPKDKENLLKY